MNLSEVLVNIPGFTIFRCDRVNRSRGGVCIVSRDNISAECIGTYDNGVCELVVLKVHSLNTKPACCYRPLVTHHQEFIPMLGELDRIFSDLSAPAPAVVLLGELSF